MNCEWKAVDGGGQFICCNNTGCPHADEMDCPPCKGTGKKRKLVEWDREQVAEFLWETYRPPTWVEWKLASNMHLVEETRQTADQLHKVLTGEK